MTEHPRYESPLNTRYASPAMQQLWSAEQRTRVWRRLWLALAEAQRNLGL
jgi:adenylosuccinate lyase